MRYLGGKSKIRKEVASFLKGVKQNNQSYFEPFVGGGWILQEMIGERVASDGNKALINMYIALQQGWIPPDFVSEDEYKSVVRNADTDNPMTAFVGFGCSFAGKWNAGYARSAGKDCYAGTTKRSLLKQLPLIKDVEFIHGLFTDHNPKEKLVYCDPPYANTTQYGAFDGFDTPLFWDTMKAWVDNDNAVVVSEYQAPDDWVCVKEMESRMGLSTTNQNVRVKRNEKLFMHKSQVSLKG